MSIALLVTVVVVYLLVVFWIAGYGDRRQFVEQSWTRHPLVYAMALGVYCTSWTFYGLVSTAAEKSWSFAPILLGPLLLFVFGQPFLRRIATLCRQENVRSIADFMASRYGKRRGIATSITLIVFIATIPYIALQIKAVTDSFLLVADTELFSPEKIALITSSAMVVFALLFGIRRLDVSGYHAGLMSAIAFESVVKLCALVAVAAFAAYFWYLSFPSLETGELFIHFSSLDPSLRFWVETAISAAAIVCLPRMFHVTFVENLSDRHLKVAGVIFPLYLFVIILCIVIIASVANAFEEGSALIENSADNYVTALPLSFGYDSIALLSFLGGFSAATAMIIVATVTLSHMLSNDVVLPILIKRQQRHGALLPPDYSRNLILARRLTVIMVVTLAYIYQRVLAGNAALTDIGLIAFALVVQIFPSLFFGIYSRQGSANATYAALGVGCFLWFVTLMIPLLAEAGAVSQDLLDRGFWGWSWLRPEHLFGLEFSDPYTRGVVLSLFFNTLFYWVFSGVGELQLADRIQAKAFVDQARARPESSSKQWQLRLNDLQELLTQFLGESATRKLVAHHQEEPGDQIANSRLLDAAEYALSGVVGVASARAILNSLSTGEALGVEDVVSIFEETTRALRFNQDMIVASFESISSGISVVNAQLRLVSWNRRYEEIFEYPQGVLRVGSPVEELVRYNASRGLLGPGSIEEHVQKRMLHLRSGKPYRVVRKHGKSVIEIKGSPLPDGGYVTTYDDISEFIDAQDKLEKSNLYLEQRVRERTAELEVAQRVAEEANRGKSRFLALASHDILQPLNAASLYTGALLENARQSQSDSYETLTHLKASIQSTESIISTLMEVAKLDTGALKTEPRIIALAGLLDVLVREFSVQIPDSVELRYVRPRYAVATDPRYLRRILQNLLSNAVKFTPVGKVLVGCRLRGDWVEICVCDTGPGIHPDDQIRVFEDYYRASSHQGVEGVGLGLAVAKRFSRLLKHPLYCKSELGVGSCFSVWVPRGVLSAESGQQDAMEATSENAVLEGCVVYYLDDDLASLHAMETLLISWGCRFRGLSSTAEMLRLARSGELVAPTILLMDLQLDHHQDGVEVAKLLSDVWRRNIPTCIVSASPDPQLPGSVTAHNFGFLRKPLKPGRLRAMIEQMVKRADASPHTIGGAPAPGDHRP